MARSKPVKAGLAVGVVFALYMFLLGLAAAWLDWGSAAVELVSSLYIGYSATFLGSIVGAVWAFVDGFIAGFLVVWFYNKF